MTATPEMTLRIVIADDNSKMLSTLVAVLSPEFEVVATANNGRCALEQIQRLQPAVAVLDLNMPELSGIEITRKVRQNGLRSGVVICSVESDPELIAAAQRAGALGYVFKTRLNRDLVAAVKCVARGEAFVSNS